MKKIIVIAFGLLFSLTLTSNSQSVRWTAFDQLNDSLRTESKPLLIFIHTNWCKFCKLQQNVTFSNQQVVDLLNENFYCLQLDAENQNTIDFLSRRYDFNPVDGHHDLADYLGKQNKELVFPTTVIVAQGLFSIKRLAGYQSADHLLPELTGFL